MSELLRVENLKKYFQTPRGELHAVDDVSFSIQSGQTLGVVGESGCGKSTLGRTVLGLLPASDGKVYLDGEDITNVSEHRRRELRRRMQIIFQDPYSSLNPRLSVLELIGDPLRAYRVYKSRKEREEFVFEIMDLVGLDRRFAYSYPHELDGGRRQRIGVARALTLNPDFIVCDEPVSALDVSIQAQILNLLKDLQDARKLTYIFVTHDLSVVKHMADDILVMYLGCTVEKCASKELFKQPLHPYTKGLLAAVPVPSIDVKMEKTVLQGEISSPIDPKPGCRFAPRCPFADERCCSVTPKFIEHSAGHFVACHKAGVAG